MEKFDYIIVGAGSAGCTLAYRLGADLGKRILLLEAGGQHNDLLLRMPIGVGKVFRNPKYNWSYVSEPEPYLDGRRLEHPRGRLVGGSSAINMMAHVRGHRADYDQLAQMGLKGWSYAEVLPYFRRSENYHGGGNVYRGTEGLWNVHRNAKDQPLLRPFLDAARELGYPIVDDYNGAEQAGFTRHQYTTYRGRRQGNANAFLEPALTRGNVTLVTNAVVTQVLLEGTRSRGVEYLRDGRKIQVHADGDVILAGGAYNSPQLLMLSGIGPAAHLRDVGITPLVDLPGVGQNLWDHPMISLAWSRKGTSYLHRELRLDRLALSMLQGYLFRNGFATSHPTAGTAFVASAPDQKIPDLQLFCRDGTTRSREWFPLIRPAAPQEIGMNCTHVRPESRGTVRLASNDPTRCALVQNNFLSVENDRRALRQGFAILRDIAGSKAFKDVAGPLMEPAREPRSNDEIDAFIRASLTTMFHPGGSCKVGTDAMSVVDPEFKVHGVEGLRVIDASVIPAPFGGNINAAVTVFADKAADVVRGVPPLPRADV